jgi:Ca2+-binding EF-hand superfamily protein
MKAEAQKRSTQERDMKTIQHTCALFSLFILLTASAALAMHPVFEKADKDGDGTVSREELKQYMKENAFEKLDQDQDKTITQSEWDRADDVIEAEEYKGVFDALDRDRNFKISLPEFSNYLEKYSNIDEAFMILDKNRDGSLAPDEVSSMPKFRLITIHF